MNGSVLDFREDVASILLNSQLSIEGIFFEFNLWKKNKKEMDYILPL